MVNTIVVCCSDSRLWSVEDELVKMGYPKGSYYRLYLFGAGKRIASGSKIFLKDTLRMIAFAIKEGVVEALILHHDDCKAYGIKEGAKEKSAQITDLRKIKTILRHEFPELRVKTHFICGTQIGVLVFEEIE
ncbi:MAG: hypothetical protein Q8N69_01830 [bacterium]|nr:hypothetical protein [bacterium]